MATETWKLNVVLLFKLNCVVQYLRSPLSWSPSGCCIHCSCYMLSWLSQLLHLRHNL